MILFTLVKRSSFESELRIMKADNLKLGLAGIGVDDKEEMLLGTIPDSLYEAVNDGYFIITVAMGKRK